MYRSRCHWLPKDSSALGACLSEFPVLVTGISATQGDFEVFRPTVAPMGQNMA